MSVRRKIKATRADLEQMVGSLRKAPMNRIWIELDKPRDEENAKQICRLANSMLRKIGPLSAFDGMTFFHMPLSHRYCYGGQMGYEELVDNGKWFNLDNMGSTKSEGQQLAQAVVDWYENAGNADPDKDSPGSVELWELAKKVLAGK